MDIPSQLETDRLLIRPLKMEDFEGFFSFLKSKEATRNLFLSPEDRTREGVKLFFEELVRAYDTPNPIFALGVVEKDTHDYVGTMGLSALKIGNSAETIFIFLPDFWGKGYAYEAGEKMFSYAFDNLKLDQLVCFLTHENEAGIKLAERLGMNFADWAKHLEYPDKVMRYTITSDDWQNR